MTKSGVDISQSYFKRKPKRALSAYNVFFREERGRILSSLLGEIPSLDVDVKEKTTKRGRPRGRNYRRRNPHRAISFEKLGRKIALNWKTVHPDMLRHCKITAEADKVRYTIQKDQYIDEHNQKPLIDGRFNRNRNASDDTCGVVFDDEQQKVLCDQKTNNFHLDSKMSKQLSLSLERELNKENFDRNEETIKNEFDPPRKKVLQIREKEIIIFASMYL